MRDRGRLVHITDPDVGLSGGELLILILIWVAVIALVTFVVVMLYRRHKRKRSAAQADNAKATTIQSSPAHQAPAQLGQASQAAPSFCPRCGNKLEANAKFCPKCGAAIKASVG